MKKRRVILWGVAMMALSVAIIAMCDIFVARNASGKTYVNVDSIPHRKSAAEITAMPGMATTNL